MAETFASLGESFQGVFRALNFPVVALGLSSALALTSILAELWVTSNQATEQLQNPNPLGDQTYDFIVVGAGSAGAVVAYRLSESGKYRVLLVEAGGDPSPFNSVPVAAGFNMHLANDWQYKTVPLKKCGYSLIDNRMRWSRGKCLGGTSILNFMIYTRGNPKDYDNWANISGDSQWSYDNVLPFFRKSEHYTGHWPDATYHGTDGPMSVSTSYKPMIDVWLRAGKELGHDTAHIDYNGRQVEGFFPIDVTMKKGQRAGTYSSFIKPMKLRRNVEIHTYATVSKILLDDNNTATGIAYKRFGRSMKAFASKEVIISGGVIGTPQLLMMSGIGPSAHLIKADIAPKVDLPGVGANLQDHVSIMLGPFVFNDTVSIIATRDLNIPSVGVYVTNGTGPFAFNLVSATAVQSSSLDKNNWPDFQLFFAPVGLDKDFAAGYSHLVGHKVSVTKDYFEPYLGRDAAFVFLSVGRPKSVGTIKLNTKNPSRHPYLNPNYFAHDDDMKVMVEGMKYAIQIFHETKAFQKYNATLSPDNKLSQCSAYDTGSDGYLECFARHLTMTEWHQCCTAKFGHDNDPMAVLHTNLSVRCVGNLRVADASVFPVIPNGNTNAPAVMIGEKCAKLVLNRWEGVSSKKGGPIDPRPKLTGLQQIVNVGPGTINLLRKK